MKMTQIGFWTNPVDLARRIQIALEDSMLVVVKRAQMDEEQFATLLGLLGEPRKKPILHIGERSYEETHNWYDRKDHFELHFDGLVQIIENKFMPVSILYGHQVEAPIGGETFFYDLTDVYQRSLADSVLRKTHWAYIDGLYTHDLATPTVRIPVFRTSPYSGKPYLLIDEWFTRGLIMEPPLDDFFGDVILRRYRECFEPALRHTHTWEQGDILLWSNETLVHGRTALCGGTRLLWRGIVWGNYRNWTRLRNLL